MSGARPELLEKYRLAYWAKKEVLENPESAAAAIDRAVKEYERIGDVVARANAPTWRQEQEQRDMRMWPA